MHVDRICILPGPLQHPCKIKELVSCPTTWTESGPGQEGGSDVIGLGVPQSFPSTALRLPHLKSADSLPCFTQLGWFLTFPSWDVVWSSRTTSLGFKDNCKLLFVIPNKWIWKIKPVVVFYKMNYHSSIDPVFIIFPT